VISGAGLRRWLPELGIPVEERDTNSVSPFLRAGKGLTVMVTYSTTCTYFLFSGGNNSISRKVSGCLILVLGVSTLDVGWTKRKHCRSINRAL